MLLHEIEPKHTSNAWQEIKAMVKPFYGFVQLLLIHNKLSLSY